MADATAGDAPDDELDNRLRVHRDAIDVLDREILGRLNERAMHAKAIGALKAGGGGADSSVAMAPLEEGSGFTGGALAPRKFVAMPAVMPVTNAAVGRTTVVIGSMRA